MSAPALAASRALAVLNYFTANPRRSFTLSELASALSVSMASLSAVLRSLTDEGYLVRHPRHKTYELGPALIAAGNAASAQHPVVELARPEMRRLAKDTSSECAGSAVVGDEILLMLLEGRPSAQIPQLILGQRIPFLPPFGEVFLAWSSDSAVEHWILQLGDRLDPAVREHLGQALAHVRQRGYSVSLQNDRLAQVAHTRTELARHPSDAALRAELIEVVRSLGNDYELLNAEPDEHYDAGLMAAPVFGVDGSVVFAVTLSGLGILTGRQIVDTAARLTSVTLHLTRQINGRLPATIVG